jgi:Hemocyanin, copper containing domain
MNGVDFPLRPENMKIENLEDMSVEDVIDMERRIRDAIDLGYFFDVSLYLWLQFTQNSYPHLPSHDFSVKETRSPSRTTRASTSSERWLRASPTFPPPTSAS